MTQRDILNLKGRWLDYLGYVVSETETASEAFDRLRQTNPDMFPVPRYYESFWMTIEDCLALANREIETDTDDGSFY